MWMKIVYVFHGLALLLATAPWLAMRRLDVTAKVVDNARGAAAVMTVIVLASLLELSFAFRWLNLALCGLALLCAARLAVFCLQAKQRLPWLPTGVLGVLGLLGVLAYALGGSLAVAYEGRVIEVAAAEGRVCRWSMYGFVTGDSGNVLDVYRRYGVVDVPLGRIVRSDVSPETNVAPPAALQHTVGECDRKVDAALREG
jgi:hypothetical protein